MKTNLTEKLKNIMLRYFDQKFKNLKLKKHKSEDYYWVTDVNENFFFEYHPDDGIGIDQDMYWKICEIFNLHHHDVDRVLTIWFKKNYPLFDNTTFYDVE